MLEALGIGKVQNSRELDLGVVPDCALQPIRGEKGCSAGLVIPWCVGAFLARAGLLSR